MGLENKVMFFLCYLFIEYILVICLGVVVFWVCRDGKIKLRGWEKVEGVVFCFCLIFKVINR